MRFVPRTPREGINVSREHPLKEAFVLTAGLVVLLAIVAALLVAFVDIVIYFVPPETEARIFSEWSFSGLLPTDFEDERIKELEDLTDRLRHHWPDAPYDFRLGLIDDESPNAIALPGGTVLVTNGLLEGVESENELAFVLAHELGHFRNRDHLRQLGRGFAFGLLLLAISGQDGGFVSSNVVDITARSFGRRQEAAADLYALELLNREFGHVGGSTDFFERLERRDSRFEGIAGYFSTHPSPADRVERLRAAAAERGWREQGELTPLPF
jgi:Zn-dependent protease with chaperone function